MSATTSESKDMSRAGHTKPRLLDNEFAALNINAGTGTQSNCHQAGSGNIQYNAQSQTFYNTSHAPEEEEKIDACLNALVVVPPERQRAALVSAKGDRAHGTCEWIKNDDGYQSLLRRDTRLLWIQGGPGKGKTMLSIYLTQELALMHRVLYFFCQADNETRRSATHVLRSLIWQLAVQLPAVAYHLPLHLYPTKDKQAMLDSRESLWSLFENMIGGAGPSMVLCLLDGLDECDEDSRRWLASKFMGLCSGCAPGSGTSDVRTIIVSRPKILGLRAHRCIMLDLHNSERIGRDIEAFVRAKVEELSSQLDGLSNESMSIFKARMQKQLLDRAEGTFLWVGFAATELLKQRTQTEMEAVMLQLPKGLPALYDRMLLQIKPQYVLTSAKLLRWVAMAVRPLSVDELADIIGPSDSDLLSSEQSIRDHILICEAFITVSHVVRPGKQNYYRPREPRESSLGHGHLSTLSIEEIVSLVHESAREYLTFAQSRGAATLENFYFEPSAVHLEMATACLNRIEQDDEPTAPHNTNCKSRRLEERPENRNMSPTSSFSDSTQRFYGYAMLYWPEHARLSGNSVEKLFVAAPAFFAKRSSLRDGWWWNVSEHSMHSPLAPYTFAKHNIPALPMACYLGIAPWVTKLLRPKAGFLPLTRQNRSYGGWGLTPLMFATIGGHVVVVDQLLRDHAKVGFQDRLIRTALDYAVINEHVEVTQRLLHQGADVDSKDEQRASVLHEAAYLGNVVLMQLLLDHTKSIEPRCIDDMRYRPRWKYGCTPLHVAAGSGHVDVMELLLGKGAKIDSRNGSQETPLHTATFSGHVKASRLLLQRGATIDTRSALGETPLHSAVMGSRTSEELLRTLLVAGADVNARSDKDETPLHVAASNSHMDTTMLCVLLQAGAEVGAETRSGMTPLHFAAQNEVLGEGVLEMLVQAGADVNSLFSDGHSPLDLALEKLEVQLRRDEYTCVRNVRCLIAFGASVDTRHWSTLLHTAASIGDEQLVKMLFDLGLGPMVSKPNCAGMTPLHLSIMGFKRMRWIELDMSLTSVESKGPVQEPPVSIVRLLLESGADVEAVDPWGNTALHYATTCGREDVARLLLEFGADVAVKADNGDSALHMAKTSGHDNLVQLLIQHGAR